MMLEISEELTKVVDCELTFASHLANDSFVWTVRLLFKKRWPSFRNFNYSYGYDGDDDVRTPLHVSNFTNLICFNSKGAKVDYITFSNKSID